jgi:hypothetical protein
MLRKLSDPVQSDVRSIDLNFRDVLLGDPRGSSQGALGQSRLHSKTAQILREDPAQFDMYSSWRGLPPAARGGLHVHKIEYSKKLQLNSALAQELASGQTFVTLCKSFRAAGTTVEALGRRAPAAGLCELDTIFSDQIGDVPRDRPGPLRDRASLEL